MLPEKLQDSLLAVAKKNGNRSRRQFTASLRKQREARAAKAANAIAVKLQSTEKDLINILYLYQKYSHHAVGRRLVRHWMSLSSSHQRRIR